MVLAARFSARSGRIAGSSPSAWRRCSGVGVAGESAAANCRSATWLDLMGRDKKNVDGRITLILLEALGRAAVVRDAPVPELEAFLAEA